MQPLGMRHGDSLLAKRLVQSRDFRPAADQPEVAEPTGGERAKRVEVMAMPARQNDDIGRFRQVGVLEPGGDVIHHAVHRVREPLGIGELLPVIDNMEPKSRSRSNLSQMLRHVAGADEVELRRCLERVDVDLHLASANESRLLRKVVVQFVPRNQRLARLERLPRLPERVVLIAAAADCPHRPAISVDQHLGANALRG